MRWLCLLTLTSCIVVSVDAWGQHDPAPTAPEPAAIVALVTGQAAPFAGQLITAVGLSRLLAEADRCDRDCQIKVTSMDDKLKVVQMQRDLEVKGLKDAIAREFELRKEILTRPIPGPPFWERPVFMLGLGFVVGALTAAASIRLGPEP